MNLPTLPNACSPAPAGLAPSQAPARRLKAWRTALFWLCWCLGLCGALSAGPATAQTLPELDLPACETSSPGQREGLALGIVVPGASPHVLDFATRLSLNDPQLNLCAESWNSLLPRLAPWASALERGQGFVAFVLAFVVVVSVLWWLTPRVWWRRTSLLGLLAVAGGTWAVAVLGLAAFHAAGGQQLLYGTVVSLRAPQQAEPLWLDVHGARELEAALLQVGYRPPVHPVAVNTAPEVKPGNPPQVPQVGTVSETSQPASNPSGAASASGASSAPVASAVATSSTGTSLAPSGEYWVAHRLNVRQGPGTQHAHIITLARGERVMFDQATQGDWWRIRTASGIIGWSSSLWLRRPGEALPPADASASPRS